MGIALPLPNPSPTNDYKIGTSNLQQFKLLTTPLILSGLESL
ncbi:hypothetical protein SLEP1_g54767 [Rubroshorea leprosula]|uniref:Uncharacterized protein n=1 Tax=Rubroshorea leprosula TaxID=152421 RepID=A0AAV5MH60_9ROSI|nr:hypothetical protein SLEP1_g54767 [Rubroshorea leprosula]